MCVGGQVAFSWLALLDALEDRKATTPYDSLDNIVELAQSVGLPSSGFSLREEVKFALLYFTELGSLSWFDEPALRSLVVLVCVRAFLFLFLMPSASFFFSILWYSRSHVVLQDPNWLIKAFSRVICDFSLHPCGQVGTHPHNHRRKGKCATFHSNVFERGTILKTQRSN